MDDRSQLDPTFFTLPQGDWRVVGPQIINDLTRIHLSIGLALAELQRLVPDLIPTKETDGASDVQVLPPADLALQMHEVAGQILGVCAGDEQDLRQIISTLRTGLAVCWDLYSIRESERVTVAEHMHNLRNRIEDFERELVALRKLKGTVEPDELN